MRTCGVCLYLDTLESTNPSVKVQRIIDDLRAEHECHKAKHEARKPHASTMAGRP